jgi:hypothetical protein
MNTRQLTNFIITGCTALLLAGIAGATPTPISQNFDTQVLGVNGWTESGGNSTTPSYNFSTTTPEGCCTPASPGYIDAKDSSSVGGTAGIMTLYAPLALFPQTAGFADLSSYDVTNGTAFYIHFALEQLSNQANKSLSGNTGKVNITGANNVIIQANFFNFGACAGCNNLPAGWNLPTGNNLFSAGIFQVYDPVTGLTTGAVSQALFTQTISAITKFGIEVELHGDSSDNVGFDAFGIDQVPEPSYSVALLAAGALGFYFKRRRATKA